MGLPGVQYLRKNMDFQLSLISIIPIETGILLHPVFRQTHSTVGTTQHNIVWAWDYKFC